MSFLIHINGRAGIGKKTIATELAPMLGARLLDNHTIINPASSVCEHGTADYYAVVDQVRRAVYAQVRKDLSATPFVLTNCLMKDVKFHPENFAAIKNLAEACDVRFLQVVITCETEENVRRLETPDRARDQKLTDGVKFRQWLKQFNTLTTPYDITLDVTTFDAKEAAEKLAVMIAQRLETYDVDQPGLVKWSMEP